MAVPTECSVLVIGGGPAGSYAATVLARENVDTVLLEAEVFPRYHIGESMLPSMRHFLRFIDLDEKFDAYGFKQKKGAMFKLNSKPEVYTDFVAAGGPKGYAWNVVRSESDELMFRHAGQQGARIFDGVKVESLEYDSRTDSDAVAHPTRASWSKKDGSTGTITFDYLIDASGRAGVVSTRYLKNRRYNQGLKNIATWGYWKNVAPYGVGTEAEGQPYFEALADASGWVWTIPLHNDVTSVGIVMNQQVAIARKKEMDSPSGRDFYLESLKLVPGIMALLKDAELTGGLKSASDWSYSASEYASHRVRIAGDAGCFIDPFFSSGVHLAIASGLSAAVTICASMKGGVDEEVAMRWHSGKVSEGYTRFLLVVLSALKQIRSQDEPILSDWDEAGFERAFAFFRPIIQGTADVSGKLTQAELSNTVDFCFKAFAPAPPDQKEEILQKVEALKSQNSGSLQPHEVIRELETSLTPEEMRILKLVQARQMLRSEDMLNIESFSTDVIDGLSANLERGQLGLVYPNVDRSAPAQADALSLLTGEERLRGVRFEAGVPKMPHIAVQEVVDVETC